MDDPGNQGDAPRSVGHQQALLRHVGRPRISVDNTSRNHRHPVAAIAAPRPGNRTSKEGTVSVSILIVPNILARSLVRELSFPRVFETKMPSAIYTPNNSAKTDSVHNAQSSPSLQPQGLVVVSSSPTDNYEDDVNNPVDGWPLLAKLIAETPDLEAFPTFTDLSIKSLLYYQAELIFLRKQLHEHEWKDFRHPKERGCNARHFATDLELFFLDRDKAIKNGNQPPQQWLLIEKIRTVQEKYSKSV
jgi:hypothetical protein